MFSVQLSICWNSDSGWSDPAGPAPAIRQPCLCHPVPCSLSSAHAGIMATPQAYLTSERTGSYACWVACTLTSFEFWKTSFWDLCWPIDLESQLSASLLLFLIRTPHIPSHACLFWPTFHPSPSPTPILTGASTPQEQWFRLFFSPTSCPILSTSSAPTPGT